MYRYIQNNMTDVSVTHFFSAKNKKKHFHEKFDSFWIVFTDLRSKFFLRIFNCSKFGSRYITIILKPEMSHFTSP